MCWGTRSHIIEASNADDEGDYRPGLQAVAECGIKSPFRYAGFTKDEIRTLSKELGLPTWSKHSFACLSSRFPYGERITFEKLCMIDKEGKLPARPRQIQGNRLCLHRAGPIRLPDGQHERNAGAVSPP
jgi:PP-loop superfamily ATP-utilizing enzyme